MGYTQPIPIATEALGWLRLQAALMFARRACFELPGAFAVRCKTWKNMVDSPSVPTVSSLLYRRSLTPRRTAPHRTTTTSGRPGRGKMGADSGHADPSLPKGRSGLCLGLRFVAQAVASHQQREPCLRKP